MTSGVPFAGFRKTKAWYKRQGLEYVKAVNPKIKDLGEHVRVPGAKPESDTVVSSNPKKQETDAQIADRLAKQFEVVSGLADSAIVGDSRSLIISGPAGFGKSYMVEEKLNDVDPNGINYSTIKGKMSAVGLYKMLFRYREAGQTILIDDCDAVFFDDIALNILKAACDSSNVRRISWNTNANLIDEETAQPIPRKFEYEGTVIFITNYDFDYLIGKGSKLSPHLQALMSRSFYIDLSMKTARDCFIRIKQVCEMGMLKEKGLTSKQECDVLDFIEENLADLREISLRTALKIGSLHKKDNMTNWRAIAKITCCKKGT